MIAAIIFAFTYVAFSVGRVPGLRSDRVAASIIGAVLLVAFRVLSVSEAQASVDGATLGLLFGMMVLSAALEVSGAFSMIGFWVTRRARSPVALFIAVSVSSALLSAFLINDVVCIAFTPLVLQIAEALERDPRPYLLALATSSNIGSVATITGNPQNILIGSLSGISYGRFALFLAPVAVLALIANGIVIWWLYRRELGGAFVARSASNKPHVYRRWIRKSSIVTAGVLLAFVLGIPPAVVALLGASAMLFTRAVNPKRLYVRIDWTLLALFTGLFVVVAGVEKAGLAERLLAALQPLHPESVWGLTLISAILSNVVSNVPAVMVLKSLVPHLPNAESAWLTLAMASTLAGNLTLPGSLATIIVVERARSRAEISFVDFLKVGLPSGVISLLIGAAWLAWHA
ncbi:anion transporter [Pendulispora rubella]|uniref:Anion transporter n=1 Tax=Pendulispora rubella TaxID=2741070 RepID=A0ABZ2LEE2_9BACT